MKQIQVLKFPPTFIIVADDVDEEQAKYNWIKKYNRAALNLSEEQQRRERQSIRQARIEQRKKFKK